MGSELRASVPGKLVALGEYAVLHGAEALVLAVDRYCEATIAPSDDARCHLETRAGQIEHRDFELGAPSGVPLIDLVCSRYAAKRVLPWRAELDSHAFYEAGTKLGLGSSAAALCAWAGVWTTYVATANGSSARHDARPKEQQKPPHVAMQHPALHELVLLHRRFQDGGSGLDVAASLLGGALRFRLDEDGMPHVGSVRLPNSVGFAGIFAGRSASTPNLVARFEAWRAGHRKQAAEQLRVLAGIAAAGCTAAREDDAGGFLEAVTAYGSALQDLGAAIEADLVTAEHRAIGTEALRHGVAYKISGAGGGDLGLAFAVDAQALDAFKKSVARRGFRVVDFALAEQGLVIRSVTSDRPLEDS